MSQLVEKTVIPVHTTPLKVIFVQAGNGVIISNRLINFVNDCLQLISGNSAVKLGIRSPIKLRGASIIANIPQDSWLCFNPLVSPHFFTVPDDVFKKLFKVDNSAKMSTEEDLNKKELETFNKMFELTIKGLEELSIKRKINFDTKLFFSTCRYRRYVIYRALMVIWLKDNSDIPYRLIGYYLKRDHSTLTNLVQTYREFIKTEKETGEMWQEYCSIMSGLIKQE